MLGCCKKSNLANFKTLESAALDKYPQRWGEDSSDLCLLWQLSKKKTEAKADNLNGGRRVVNDEKPDAVESLK